MVVLKQERLVWMEKLYEEFADLLEVDEVAREDELEEFEEWDSLSALSILAMIDAEYNVQISSEELAKVHTIGDIEDLVKEKMAANG